MVDFYHILTDDHAVPAENITFLLVGNSIPSGYEEIIDGIATADNFMAALYTIGSAADGDDLVITNIECHGTGYLGYSADSPRNVAYHGYTGVQPLVNQTGNPDEFDYLESQYEMSVFCGSGQFGNVAPTTTSTAAWANGSPTGTPMRRSNAGSS